MKRLSLIVSILITAISMWGDLSEVTFSVSSQIDSNMNLIESVNILIPAKSLIFKRNDGDFEAKLSIQYSFFDKKGNPVDIHYHDTLFIAQAYERTVDETVFSILKTFITDDDYANIKIAVFDMNSSNQIEFQSDILTPYSKSDKSYIRKLVPLNSRDWHFFNPDSIGLILNYEFIDSASYMLKLEIRDPDRTYLKKKYKPTGNAMDTIILSPDINTGKYSLRAELLENNSIISYVSTDFFIDFSFIHSDKEYNDILNALSNIAMGSEISLLRFAPRTERESRWVDFWQRAADNPVLSGGLSYYDFMDRYHYVQKHYGVYNKEGYKTDFGRIHIVYGKPDEIESHPFDMESKPYVIWYYYSLGYEFRFVDMYGYGEYKLVNYYEQLR